MRTSTIKENFVSHHDEPQVGDAIVNNNPDCKHYESEGIVIKIESLPEDKGKTASYKCTNDGDNWKKGDVLTKTMDQLTPIDDVDRVVSEILEGLASPTFDVDTQIKDLIQEMLNEDDRAAEELLSPHNAHVLKEEYITQVLGLQIPLNESYPYTPTFRSQVLHEQRLLEGFWSDLQNLKGNTASVMGAVGVIIKDSSKVGDFVKRIKTGAIDEPLRQIREFLTKIWEVLKEWGMKVATKIADAAKKVLDTVTKLVKKVFSMSGWKQALSIIGLAIGMKYVWNEIGKVVKDGNKRIASVGDLMANVASGELKKAVELSKKVEESYSPRKKIMTEQERLEEFGFLSALFGGDDEEEDVESEELKSIDADDSGDISPEEVTQHEEKPEQKEKAKKEKDEAVPVKVGIAIKQGEAIPKDGVFLTLDQAKEAGIRGETEADIKNAKEAELAKKADKLTKDLEAAEKNAEKLGGSIDKAQKVLDEGGSNEEVIEAMPDSFKDKIMGALAWFKENILGTVVKFIQKKIIEAGKNAILGAASGGVASFVNGVGKLYGGVKFVANTLGPHLKGFGSEAKEAMADAKKDPEKLAKELEKNESILRSFIRESISAEMPQKKSPPNVRGYLKPTSCFHTLAQWESVVNQLIKLQEEGVDTRGGKLRSDQRLLAIIEQYFGYLLNEEVQRWDLLTTKNVLDFIEDFANHRFWGLEKEFGHYFPDVTRLKFAYFYSRGDIEPYVLMDEEYTTQLYGTTHNPKELLHYTSASGLERLQKSIQTGQTFDISTFTVAERPFFRPESNLIVHMVGNVRAGFRSDIKSMATDSGRRACNLYRLEYPGKDLNNICDELKTCDGSVRTSLWNEYIATPIEIVDVYEMVREG